MLPNRHFRRFAFRALAFRPFRRLLQRLLPLGFLLPLTPHRLVIGSSVFCGENKNLRRQRPFGGNVELERGTNSP